jgi:hypothetical protein
MAFGGTAKKGKGGRRVKKDRGGWGRKTPASIQGLRVNLGRAAVVTTFQVVIMESWSQTYKLQQFEQREGQNLK